MDDKKTEVRIIIRRGVREDCRAVIDLYDPPSGKLTKLELAAGPREEDIAVEVRKLRTQLERAGHWVSYKEI